MSLESLILFSVAFFASAITPGPDTMTLLGKSIGGGFIRALPFAAGIALAKLVLLSAALFGLAELAENARTVFVVVKWLGAGWLVFTGLRKLKGLWDQRGVTPPEVASASPDLVEGAVADRIEIADVAVGFALGISNPVAITFYVAILPSVIDLSAGPIAQWAPLAGALLAMFTIVTVAWAGLGYSFRHVLTSPKSRRYLKVGEGTVLIVTGSAIALRQ